MTENLMWCQGPFTARESYLADLVQSRKEVHIGRKGKQREEKESERGNDIGMRTRHLNQKKVVVDVVDSETSSGYNCTPNVNPPGWKRPTSSPRQEG